MEYHHIAGYQQVIISAIRFLNHYPDADLVQTAILGSQCNVKIV